MSLKDSLETVLKASRQKGLPCLLIGGNAIILLGFARLTLDIDLLVPVEKRFQWLDLMRELGYRLHYGTETFAQFNPGSAEMTPVDLMIVDASTWKSLDAEAQDNEIAGHVVRVPRVEHLIALKLHAAASLTRDSREQDWQDIRQMVHAWHLNPGDPYFEGIILRYGGDEALKRIQRYWNES